MRLIKWMLNAYSEYFGIKAIEYAKSGVRLLDYPEGTVGYAYGRLYIEISRFCFEMHNALRVK